MKIQAMVFVLLVLIPYSSSVTTVPAGLEVVVHAGIHDTDYPVLVPFTVFRKDTRQLVTDINAEITVYNSLGWSVVKKSTFITYEDGMYAFNITLPADMYSFTITVSATINGILWTGTGEGSFEVRETKNIFDKIQLKIQELRNEVETHNTTFLSDVADQLQNLSGEINKLIAEFQTALSDVLKAMDPGYNITLVIDKHYNAPDLSVLDSASFPYTVEHNLTFSHVDMSFDSGSVSELWDMILDDNYTTGNVLVLNSPYIPVNTTLITNPPAKYYNASAGDTWVEALTRAIAYFVKTKSVTVISASGITRWQFIWVDAGTVYTQAINSTLLTEIWCNNTVWHSLASGSYYGDSPDLLDTLAGISSSRYLTVPNVTWSEYPVYVGDFQNYVEIHGRAVWMMFDGAYSLVVDNTYFQTSVSLFAPYIWMKIGVDDKVSTLEKAYEETGNVTFLEIKDQLLNAFDQRNWSGVNDLLTFEFYNATNAIQRIEEMNETLEGFENNSDLYAGLSTGSEQYGQPMCISDTARRIIEDLKFMLQTLLNVTRDMIEARNTLKQMISDPWSYSWDQVININKLFHEIATSLASSVQIGGHWKVHVDGVDTYVGPFHVSWYGWDVDLDFIRRAINHALYWGLYLSVNNPSAVLARSLLTFVVTLAGTVLMQSTFQFLFQFVGIITDNTVNMIRMFSSVLEILSQVLVRLTDAITNISFTLQDVFDSIKNITLTMLDSLSSAFEIASDKLDTVATFFQNISGFVSEAIELNKFVSRGATLLSQISQALGLELDVEKNIRNSENAMQYVVHVQNTFSGHSILVFDTPDRLYFVAVDGNGDMITTSFNISKSWEDGNGTTYWSSTTMAWVRKEQGLTAVSVITGVNATAYVTGNITPYEILEPVFSVRTSAEKVDDGWDVTVETNTFTNSTPSSVEMKLLLKSSDGYIIASRTFEMPVLPLETANKTVHLTVPTYVIGGFDGTIVLEYGENEINVADVTVPVTWYAVLFWISLILGVASIIVVVIQVAIQKRRG